MKLVIALLLPVILYYPSLGAPLLFDDLGPLQKDPHLVKPFFTYLSTASYKFELYRPVTRASFWVTSRIGAWCGAATIGSVSPGIHRSFNLCLLLLSQLSLYWLLKTTTHPFPIVISFLWAIHPLTSFAIMPVIQRGILLCALFSFSSLALFLKRSYWWLPLAVLATLSKEIGVVVFFAAFILRPTKVHGILLIPLVIIPLLFMPSLDTVSIKGFSFVGRLLDQPGAIRSYALSFILPIPDHLSLERDLTPAPLDLCGVMFVICCIVVTVLRKNQWYLISLVSLLPESVPFLLEPRFDHRVILPMAWFLVGSRPTRDGVAKTLLTLATVFCTLMLSVWLWYWHEPSRIYRHGVDLEGSWRSRYNLGTTLLDSGTLYGIVESEQRFREALVFRPNFISARVNLGVALWTLGKRRMAVQETALACRVSKDACTNLGMFFLEENKNEFH